MSAKAGRWVWRLFGAVACVAAAACAESPATLPVSPPAPQPREAIDPGPYTPGNMYTGRNGYIEYYPGNSPMIFAAPHGGLRTPAEIPDRTATSCGDEITLLADLYTRELAMEIRAEFYNRTGRYPHVIVNRVHRKKVEPNRDLRSGACLDEEAEIAWNEYHEFLDVARARVTADHGHGWLTDLHGHAHSKKRLELGYVLRGGELRLTDATLDGDLSYEEKSSIRTFSENTTVAFSRLLRGPGSLGTLLAEAGHPAVPSAQDPAPLATDSFFSGGYTVDRHACAHEHPEICGVQIEHDTNVKIPDSARATYVSDLLRVYETYLAQNFGWNMATGTYDVMVDNDNLNNDTTHARFVGASSWTSTSQPAQKHLNTVLLSDGASSTDEGAFLFKVDSGGTYRVYARWPSASSLTTAAVYRIVGVDGATVLDEVTANQQQNAGQWNLLGTYTFSQTGWARVGMARYAEDDGTIAMDAVRVMKQ